MNNSLELIILLTLFTILTILILLLFKARKSERSEDNEPDFYKNLFDQFNESKKLGKLEEELSNLKERASEWNSEEKILKKNIDRQEGEISKLEQDILQEQRKLSERLSNTSGNLNYGEIALERTLELSGLSQGIDYFLQEKMKNNDGENIKDINGKDLIPDATIKFPDSRYLYIDAKYPDQALRKLKLDNDSKAYTKKLKALITNLSNDDYPNRGMDTPGFCIMFVPGDHYILEAIKDDKDILEFALRRDIVLATPGTLFSIIKTVELSFRRDQLNQKANDFYQDARRLIDTTERFIISFNTMELKIRDIQKAYNEIRNSLEDDRVESEGLLSQLRRIDKEIVKEELTDTKSTPVKK